MLKDAGRISAEVAKRLAETEFEKYQEKLRIKEATEPTSDFDKVVEEVNRLERKKWKLQSAISNPREIR